MTLRELLKETQYVSPQDLFDQHGQLREALEKCVVFVESLTRTVDSSGCGEWMEGFFKAHEAIAKEAKKVLEGELKR